MNKVSTDHNRDNAEDDSETNGGKYFLKNCGCIKILNIPQTRGAHPLYKYLFILQSLYNFEEHTVSVVGIDSLIFNTFCP